VSYQLRQTQLIRVDLPTVFAFFKDPRNLDAITPPWLGFRVLEASDREVAEGTRIRYRLRLHGIPLQWESRIAEYHENARFADTMVSGPYRTWYHQHVFRAVPEGVEIEDVVDYDLPFGLLGRLAHGVAVRRQLVAIFAYRRQRIDEVFHTKEVVA
jgi:hypothetical protein